MAITTTDRIRENSTALRPFSCEVSTLRRQATVKNISGERERRADADAAIGAGGQPEQRAAMKASEMRLDGLVMVVPWPPIASRLERMNRHVRTNSSKRVRAR